MSGEPLFILGVFAAGLVSFFSPCFVPLLPAYVAYLSGSGTENSKIIQFGRFRLRLVLLLKTLSFVIGLSTVFLFLGFGFGALGQFVVDSRFIAVCGLLVLLFGFIQTGMVKIPLLEKERKLSFQRIDKGGYSGAFLLGLSFSFGWTPCIGPVLASILSVAAGAGSALEGSSLLLVYTLGLTIPFILIAIFSDFLLQRIRGWSKHLQKVRVISGCMLMVMGVLLMTDQLNSITVWIQ